MEYKLDDKRVYRQRNVLDKTGAVVDILEEDDELVVENYELPITVVYLRQTTEVENITHIDRDEPLV